VFTNKQNTKCEILLFIITLNYFIIQYFHNYGFIYYFLFNINFKIRYFVNIDSKSQNKIIIHDFYIQNFIIKIHDWFRIK